MTVFFRSRSDRNGRRISAARYRTLCVGDRFSWGDSSPVRPDRGSKTLGAKRIRRRIVFALVQYPVFKNTCHFESYFRSIRDSDRSGPGEDYALLSDRAFRDPTGDDLAEAPRHNVSAETPIDGAETA